MKPPHIKEIRQKCVRKIIKRQREICKEQQALGYIKLEQPTRHGWFKEIVITTKVERYKNEAAILELFEVIKKSFWGRTKKEADEKWQEHTSKHLIYKEFPTITKKQFNRLSHKAQKLCTVFRYQNECKKWKVRFYIRIPKAAYNIKYTRAYITHSKCIDPVLESEEDLLQQQLYKNEYYNLYQKIWSWKGYYYWNTLEDKKKKLKVKKGLNELKKYTVETILKDNISWDIN